MHENHRARLRNRYRNEGLGSFEPHEILELLLFYALPRRDTNALAHTLIRHFGNLSGVLGASVEDLAAVPGMGEHSAILLHMMLPLQRAYLKDASRERKPLTNANIAIDYARNLFAGRRSEALFLLCLDSRCRLIRECLLLEGTVSEVSVHPRRIVECALQNNSVQVMLMHNHPEGDPQPSKSDLLYTSKVALALATIGITLADHLIAGESDVYSFARSGDMSTIEMEIAVRMMSGYVPYATKGAQAVSSAQVIERYNSAPANTLHDAGAQRVSIVPQADT